MGAEKTYTIPQKYVPAVIDILKKTGHSVDSFQGESAILFNNVMKGVIGPLGNIQIDTTD